MHSQASQPPCLQQPTLEFSSKAYLKFSLATATVAMLVRLSSEKTIKAIIYMTCLSPRGPKEGPAKTTNTLFVLQKEILNQEFQLRILQVKIVPSSSPSNLQRGRGFFWLPS